MLIISYPHNPTTAVVEIDFFERIVDFAKRHRLIVIHDFAYADIVFDDYKAPSFLQVKGAKDVGVEFFSLSKSYSMAGWRVGFAVGNSRIIQALTQLKSYLDYGIFQPIQIASIIALNGPQDCVEKIAKTYEERRDVLVRGLDRIGWQVKRPKATMYVWARIPERFRRMGSVRFSNMLIEKAKVAVAPGLGFGEYGDEYVRFALVENTLRIKQAVKGMRRMMEQASPKMPKSKGRGIKKAREKK
jgi:alanine-synthesizing transaminase